MKKLLFILIIVFSITTVVDAQVTSGGFHRAGTSPVKTKKLKERLMEEFKISDDQANTVVTTEQDYQLKLRAIKMDKNTSEETKKTKLQEIDEERNGRLKGILTDEQISKLEMIVREVNKQR